MLQKIPFCLLQHLLFPSINTHKLTFFLEIHGPHTILDLGLGSISKKLHILVSGKSTLPCPTQGPPYLFPQETGFVTKVKVATMVFPLQDSVQIAVCNPRKKGLGTMTAIFRNPFVIFKIACAHTSKWNTCVMLIISIWQFEHVVCGFCVGNRF